MSRNRYNDYYLVNDEDVEESIEVSLKQTRNMCKKAIIIVLIGVTALSLIAIILAFVVFPLIFMFSVSLQEKLVFTHSDLPSSRAYYEYFRFPGLKNHYVQVKDLNSDTNLSLGLWHILPFNLAVDASNNSNFDYDEALLNSNYSVLLYFHGTGEDRSQSSRKYQLFRNFFHVITFDYRGYGDSTPGDLFERNVVSDSLQVFNWLRNRTNSNIYVWGHSLGTSLASNMLSQLKNSSEIQGLILEAPFTSFADELYQHRYVKFFSWLPWFKATIIKPLERNGFIFNTSAYIEQINCSMMFLHAIDDDVVPYYMSKKLYDIAKERDKGNEVVLHLYDAKLKLKHNFIYQDPYTVFFIYDFMNRTSSEEMYLIEGSHQS
ncbi:hypothetical protein GWI33_012777 [Rhynchophorus ferrugineus]|uniref:AB hydrolase-1 domain-containing protein n=1 Tax=Rhynchophorus ferrugineus TaxID=354439 RepID=A0A834MDV7_RHYFE|nr:hypothetical protein GWI33_012777 [Rhynchophorus ferrugineus]